MKLKLKMPEYITDSFNDIYSSFYKLTWFGRIVLIVPYFLIFICAVALLTIAIFLVEWVLDFVKCLFIRKEKTKNIYKQ